MESPVAAPQDGAMRIFTVERIEYTAEPGCEGGFEPEDLFLLTFALIGDGELLTYNTCGDPQCGSRGGFVASAVRDTGDGRTFRSPVGERYSDALGGCSLNERLYEVVLDGDRAEVHQIDRGLDLPDVAFEDCNEGLFARCADELRCVGDTVFYGTAAAPPG